MKEMERQVMCVLLRSLMDKNLITQDIHDQAKEKVLGTLDGPEFFCYARDTAEDIPFAACANLPPQSIVLEEPQYPQYCDPSKTRLEPESSAQSIKKTPSAVSGKREEDANGHTQNSR